MRLTSLFRRRRVRHRLRWWTRVRWPEHEGWTAQELAEVRKDVLARIGARHGTDGWPT